jgi:NlpC/P60 family putative phage cell wall peptidase
MEINSNYLPLCGEVGEPKANRVGDSGEVASAPHPKFARDAHEFRPPHNGGGKTDDIVAIARSWIGTPYVHQASLKGVGCDCLGLLRGIWRDLRGEEAEETPPYSRDWAEARAAETLYMALKRHAHEIDTARLAPGDIALFRMASHGPAKHCGIVAKRQSACGIRQSDQTAKSIADCRLADAGLTLIHARQNKRVSEEPLSPFWRSRLAFAFRL